MKRCCDFKTSLFVLFNATAESVNCSLFLKNLEKHFCNVTGKNFVKHIENLPQHLSEKCIGDNSSITDIAFRNRDLSIIGIAQGFFEIIDYRYRFITERFIVPITVRSKQLMKTTNSGRHAQPGGRGVQPSLRFKDFFSRSISKGK